MTRSRGHGGRERYRRGEERREGEESASDVERERERMREDE